MIKKNMPIACSIAINRRGNKNKCSSRHCMLVRWHRSYGLASYDLRPLRSVNESRLIAVATTAGTRVPTKPMLLR